MDTVWRTGYQVPNNCRGRGQPILSIPTGGQAHAAPQTIPLLAGIGTTDVTIDTGYERDNIQRIIAEQRTVAAIPPISHRRVLREYHRELYQQWNPQRHPIERAFNKLKHRRVIATGYDRKSLHSLAALSIAAPVFWRV